MVLYLSFPKMAVLTQARRFTSHSLSSPLKQPDTRRCGLVVCVAHKVSNGYVQKPPTQKHTHTHTHTHKHAARLALIVLCHFPVTFSQTQTQTQTQTCCTSCLDFLVSFSSHFLLTKSSLTPWAATQGLNVECSMGHNRPVCSASTHLSKEFPGELYLKGERPGSPGVPPEFCEKSKGRRRGKSVGGASRHRVGPGGWGKEMSRQRKKEGRKGRDKGKRGSVVAMFLRVL